MSFYSRCFEQNRTEAVLLTINLLLMSGVLLMPYELFISKRYLKAKRKQVFVSIITFISIFGIFLGVAALIIVLAVMNGFEEDLRNKILGVNSHICILYTSDA